MYDSLVLVITFAFAVLNQVRRPFRDHSPTLLGLFRRSVLHVGPHLCFGRAFLLCCGEFRYCGHHVAFYLTANEHEFVGASRVNRPQHAL